MINYKAFEMHTHTIHSDGDFTLHELCANAKKYQLNGIALTDHNTVSGWQELEAAPDSFAVPIIKGIEWTTFFGHMVVLGAKTFVDWRYALPDTIDESIKQIKAADGIVGIAHPFELGSPMCTGCHWDFHINHWENVNYIEVWSKSFPTKQFDNNLAYPMWFDLLNRGFHLAATAGRDWHSEGADKELAAVTYIGIEDAVISSDAACQAIRKGRVYVTLGPTISLTLHKDNRDYSLGDTISMGNCACEIKIDQNVRTAFWKPFGVIPEHIDIIANGKVVQSTILGKKDVFHFNLNLEPGWMIMEVTGKVLDENEKKIAFTSPIYVLPEAVA